MNARYVIGTLVCLLLVAVACQTAEPQVIEVTRVVTEVETITVEVEGEAIEVTRVVAEEVNGDAGIAATERTGMTATPIGTAVRQTAQQQRLIIKNGEMTITVEDTATAVDQAIDTAVNLGGYIISQQVSANDQGHRFATMRLAVPVLRFEEALQQFRRLGTVTHEAASGQDVTDEYVDLQSRLNNLIATRDRLRTFLEQATTIEEALRINEELKIVEEEIAVIQGRLNYLGDRAAFSTINLTLNPWLPTPTPSPTPSPTPIPTAQAWHPAHTAQLAAVDLQESAQETADFLIYYGILCIPWLLLLALAIWPVWKVIAWYRRRPFNG